MTSQLYRVDGPWPGTLVIAARPRGGDWLHDEVAAWKGAGVHSVVSLITRDEEQDLDLNSEASEAARQGLAFLSLPIPAQGAAIGKQTPRIDRRRESQTLCGTACTHSLPTRSGTQRFGGGLFARTEWDEPRRCG